MTQHLLSPTFQPWPSIPRLNRDMIVTEKIDGTNAAVGIIQHQFGKHGDEPVPETTTLAFASDDRGPDGLPVHEYLVYAQSRRRIITPDDDNYGFARWVSENAGALARLLGPGLHYGEWWGLGIQRGYDQKCKRLSLFNVHRWGWLDDHDARVARAIPGQLGVVPVLAQHTFSTRVVEEALDELRVKGSQAAPGFMNPEGVVVYHTAAGSLYKATLERDGGKGNG